MKIGILAVQGDYEAHAKILKQLNVGYAFVTRPEDLKDLNGLIIPGGESTTMLKFLAENNFLTAIKTFASQHPLFGTCAGAILLAQEVLNPPQISLQLMDVTIERNAYGRQLESHIGKGYYLDNPNPIEMIFIRAPKIVRLGQEVATFATYQGEPVGVRQGHFMMTTFHPELTDNTAIHELFIDQCSP